MFEEHGQETESWMGEGNSPHVVVGDDWISQVPR